MKALMPLLGALTLLAWPDYRKPTDDERKAIMSSIRLAVAEAKMSQKLEAAAEIERQHGHLADWLRLHQEAQSAESEYRLNAISAIFDSCRAYGIEIPMNGKIANGPMAGSIAQWDPVALPKDEPSVYRKVTNAQGEDHYLGGLMPANNGGLTLPDGSMFINYRVFDVAMVKDQPEVLAYIVQHETFHFTELTSRGWDTKEGRELRAYTSSEKFANEVGLEQENKDFIDKAYNYNRASVLSGTVNPAFPTATDEASNRAAFELDEQRFARFIDERDRALQSIASNQKVAQHALELTQRTKSQYDVRPVTPEILAEEMAKCGFDEAPAENFRPYGGFKNDKGYDFRLKQNTDVGMLKASMYLARICSDEAVGKPCNEALDIIDARWNDPSFKRGLAFHFEDRIFVDTPDSCLIDIYTHLNVPVSLKQLSSIVGQYHYYKKRDAEKADREYLRDREREESSGHGRGDQGEAKPRQERSKDHDFTRAHQTVDRYNH